VTWAVERVIDEIQPVLFGREADYQRLVGPGADRPEPDAGQVEARRERHRGRQHSRRPGRRGVQWPVAVPLPRRPNAHVLPVPMMNIGNTYLSDGHGLL
jgi:hypothetical protein